MIATGPRLWPIFPTEEIVYGERCGIFLKMRSGFQLLTKMMWEYFAGADCLTFSWNGQASQRVWNVLKVKCQILLNMEISFLVQIGSRRNDCLVRHFSVTNHLEVTSSMENIFHLTEILRSPFSSKFSTVPQISPYLDLVNPCEDF